jgi:hypothetical protein
MLNIDTLFLFLFIFSTLSMINFIFKFIRAIFRPIPEKISLDTMALIYFGLCVSYFITFLIQK